MRARGTVTSSSLGRRAKFDSDAILDVTAQLIASGGPGQATVGNIAKALDAPTGSIYHRFDSRDLVMARLWVRTAERAQAGFLAALANDDVEVAAREAALHIPKWSRGHLSEATVMLLYRRRDLSAQWPEELGADLDRQRETMTAALKSFTRRLCATTARSARQAVNFALLDIPYAAVRPYLLVGDPPPTTVDHLVATSSWCVLQPLRRTG